MSNHSRCFGWMNFTHCIYNCWTVYYEQLSATHLIFLKGPILQWDVIPHEVSSTLQVPPLWLQDFPGTLSTFSKPTSSPVPTQLQLASPTERELQELIKIRVLNTRKMRHWSLVLGEAEQLGTLGPASIIKLLSHDAQILLTSVPPFQQGGIDRRAAL